MHQPFVLQPVDQQPLWSPSAGLMPNLLSWLSAWNAVKEGEVGLGQRVQLKRVCWKVGEMKGRPEAAWF